MRELSTLNRFFYKYRKLFFLGILFVILTNYFRILAPQITGYVINTVVHAVDGSGATLKSGGQQNLDIIVRSVLRQFDLQPAGTKILFAALILLLLAIISGLFMFLMRQTIIVMSRHIEYDQKNEVFAHYQQLDSAFYRSNSTGDLMNRISEDVSRVRMYTGPSIMYFINLAAVISFSIFFMLRADVKLTLVALAPLPLLALAIYFVNNIINTKSERIQALLSNLTSNAQESYSGIRVIKSFVQERSMLHFFERNSQGYKDAALSLAKTEAIYFPSMALMIGLSTLITIMVGALDVVNQVPGATVGKIAEFVLYIQMLTFPVSAIGLTASMTQRAAASQRRINAFLLKTPAIQDGPAAKPRQLMGDIKLENVSFRYPDTGIEAIQNFSLHIRRGEKIAIVGRTGSGKSTLAQLLLRMYDVDKGTILYDDVPVQEIQLSSLRSQLSYVPQEVFLFSDTIRNNIAFGDGSATDEAIEQAARQASIYNEISYFAEGMQTMVGERGVTLSGGQKQRISIARALLKEPNIVLFDDCLSAVDARTEQNIIRNLYDYLKDKTAIIITHRVFALLEFDKIVVMEQGRIVECGPHEELLALNGYYASMYKRQQQAEAGAGESLGLA